MSWSNHAGDLALSIYFDTTKSSLESSYNVKGLQPILRENEGLYWFILKDEKDRIYLLEEDGHLLWVKDKRLEK